MFRAELEQEEEQKKLTKQDVVKRFYIFAFNVFQMKDILRCCICLEIYTIPTESSKCRHIFCKDCIEEYLEYTEVYPPRCPICQTPICTNSLNDHTFFGKIAVFTKTALQNIQLILGSGCTKLPPFPAVFDLWEQNENSSEMFTHIKNVLIHSSTLPDYSAILNAKKVVVDATAKYPKSIQEEKSPFDLLMQSSTQNTLYKQAKPNCNNKTYGVKKHETQNTNHGHMEKVLEFEDRSNKIAILKWLEDGGNKFDHLPMTQMVNSEEVVDFDMPSVSQLPLYKDTVSTELNNQKQEQSKITKTSNTITQLTQNKCKERGNRRTRSAECCMKPVQRKPQKKRHSITVYDNANDEIVIEDIDSAEVIIAENANKIAIVNLLENEYLNTIDTEMLPAKKNSTKVGKDVKEKSKRSSLQDTNKKIDNNSIDVSRGWQRVNEIKKTFRKTEKKCSKLKVVSRTTSTNTISKVNEKHQLNLRSQNKTETKLPTKIEETIQVCQENKAFDLNEIELYFTNNLSKIVAECSKVNNPDIELIETQQDFMSKTDKIKCDLDAASKKKVKVDTPSFQIITTCAVIENKHLQEKLERKESKLAVNIALKSVVEPDCPYLETNQDQANNSEVEKDITVNESVEPVLNKMGKTQEESEVDYDDDDIFNEATQIITVDKSKLDEQVDNSCTLNVLNKKLTLIRNILNLYDDRPTILDDQASALVHKLKTIVNDVNMEESTLQNTTKTVYVQTEELKVLFCNKTTATDLPEIQQKNVGMQTDSLDCSNGFRISSTAMFNIQPVINSFTQTERVCCLNCNFDMDSGKKSGGEMISSQGVTRASDRINNIAKQYIFSSSFDNIDFETQDLVRGQHISIQNPQNSHTSIHNNNVIGDKEIKRPRIEEAISFQSNSKAQTSKEAKNFKRIRPESSDSDSENCNLLKKNKFADQDASLIFSDTVEDIKNTCKENSQDMDEMNKNANKDFSKDCVMPDMKKNKQTCKNAVFEEPLPKRLKTQDIIKECEMIIKEACSTTLRIERTQCPQEPSKLSLDELEEEFSRNFEDNEHKKTQSKSINQKLLNNKFSESLYSPENFNKTSEMADKPPQNKTNDNNNVGTKSVDDVINRFKDLDDSFEDNAEIQFITDTIAKTHKQNNNKICILQNVVIPNEVQHITPIIVIDDDASVKSEEIVDSDQEVIETTPQKNRPTPKDAMSSPSQAYYKPDGKLQLPPPLGLDITNDLDNILSCFNKTFTPPPEFQDFSNENKTTFDGRENEYVVPASSLTPDLLLIENHSQPPAKNAPLLTSTPFSCTSQILTSRTFNISPIPSSGKQINSILAAQNSSKLPLIIKTPTKQRMVPLNTSTPKQNSILKYAKPRDTSKFDDSCILKTNQKTNSTLINKKPNVCCTRMNKDELLNITSLANKKLIVFTNTFSSCVTHMIVPVGKRNCLQDQTMKYVFAVASGIWVVSIKWIQKCLEQNKVVPEEPYEVLDVSGSDGPRRSRLNRMGKPLLDNYKIHAAPPFRSTTRKELENVILLLGGEVVSQPEDLINKNGKICLIITESNGSQDSDIYETWLNTLKVITVDLEWLSRSVGKFQTLSLRPFALCSEESLCGLAYPSSLLEDIPYSYSHTTMN